MNKGITYLKIHNSEKLKVLPEYKNSDTKKYVIKLLSDKGANPLPVVKMLHAIISYSNECVLNISFGSDNSLIFDIFFKQGVAIF